MRHLLLAFLIMLLPLGAQAAEGMTWDTTNDPYLDMSSLHIVAGSYEYGDGTTCKVLLFKQSWGSYYQAGGLDCPPQATGGGSEALLQSILEELQSKNHPWENGLKRHGN